ncbi:MAG TPA: hypothetical protein VF613_10415, partial [Longimicrobium sp.]
MKTGLLSALAACGCVLAAHPSQAQVSTTPETVYREWNQNEAAAKARYAGKTVLVTGSAPVVSLSQFAGSSSVWIRASYRRVITCNFNDAHRAELEAINADRPVTVVGQYSGFGPGGLGLQNCRVASTRNASTPAAPESQVPPLPRAAARPPHGGYAAPDASHSRRGPLRGSGGYYFARSEPGVQGEPAIAL